MRRLDDDFEDDMDEKENLTLMTFDMQAIRQQFPGISRPAIFFDNPGGTQMVRASLERMQRLMVDANANHGGLFATSRQMDETKDQARESMAAFLNASRPEEIIFGANMTTLTYTISRALGRTFQKDDLLVVTHLDHDANVSPWLQIAEDHGLRVHWVDFDLETGMLDMEDMQRAIEQKPRLVAVGYASNALGTINPVEKITQWAHDAGALVYIDAVQFAPHAPIDVQALGCDFLVCSAYKFYGPHAGVLYGKYDLLDALAAYKVRPALNLPPDKFETGTGNFEAIAGILGVLEYFEWFGNTFGEDQHEKLSPHYSGRALALKQAMHTMKSYDRPLNKALLEALEPITGMRIYGITDE
ncbi:MAG: cysteine desulfurase-like protein, partial [Anaerolineaceae bacterium]|nr:cysteine desulfurase-like protein [Anaerolineaceae bacterium]